MPARPDQTKTIQFEHRLVKTADVDIHVAEAPGHGQPLVLLHGIGMDWRVWQAVSRRLAPWFHLYLFDLRGHGQSGKPPHGYTLAHYAADVEDVIDLLGIRPAVLVGSSLGGMVAVSIEAPVDAVSHRVLVDPPLTGGPIRDRDMFEAILRLKHEPVPELAEYLGRSNPGAGSFWLKTMSEMWHGAADGVIQDMLARPDDYYAVDPALRLDEAPTLLMQADPALGGVLSDEQAELALSELPNGAVLRVPGAGHAIHAYRPREFVDAIVRFVGAKKIDMPD
jgi:3-oxoadipate enol-lactonase